MAKVTLTFSLDSEAHKDILDFFASLPERKGSRTFRLMARAYMHGKNNDLTLDDLYQEIAELKLLVTRILESGVTIAQDENHPDDSLISEVENKLAKLGL